VITDALLRFVAWVVETVDSWMPTYTTPAWLSDLSGNLQPVLDTAASLGNWVPMALGLQVAGAVLLAVIVGLGIKVVRSVASYFLAGGGSSG
jgi:hypothetical protein